MLALLITAALATSTAPAVDAPIPPMPARWVTDVAGLMSPVARDALDRRLEAYERATGHQVVVWIGTTIGGAPLDDWAVRTFAAWKVGRRGKDDGVAMFVLAADRTIDIEVGYGLEDKLTDAAASRIIRDVMTPRLRTGDADGAIAQGADAILATIEGAPWAGQGAAPSRTAGGTGEPSITELVGGAILILFLLVIAIRHPRTAMLILWSLRGRGGGGGFGGGGGGGFSGGGGRSGGGGARGGW